MERPEDISRRLGAAAQAKRQVAWADIQVGSPALARDLAAFKAVFSRLELKTCTIDGRLVWPV